MLQFAKWPRADSNRRHPGFQPGALPTELPGLFDIKIIPHDKN
jgi:hypothetical protein